MPVPVTELAIQHLLYALARSRQGDDCERPNTVNIINIITIDAAPILPPIISWLIRSECLLACSAGFSGWFSETLGTSEGGRLLGGLPGLGPVPYTSTLSQTIYVVNNSENITHKKIMLFRFCNWIYVLADIFLEATSNHVDILSMELVILFHHRTFYYIH